MIRRTKFGRGYSPQLLEKAAEDEARVEVFTPVLGLHRGDAAQDIGAGYTPDAQNFVSASGMLTPRSGLSQFKGGNAQFGGAPVLGAVGAFDVLGEGYTVAASSKTLSIYDPNTDAWSALSYVLVSPFTTNQIPSGTSRNYWDGAHIYDAALDRNIVVMTNHVDVPKSVTLQASVASYSDLTDFISVASAARSVCAYDNRLVWWNILEASNNTIPQRVLWSARGLPRNYQLAMGAGFEDILDMRGVGTKIVEERDGVLLFSDEEIWRGRSRNDAYVFDFYAIEKGFGAPYPQTVVKTPIGVIFVGRDLELYVVQGDTVTPLGPKAAGEVSRVQPFLQETLLEPARMWAEYDPGSMRYCLFYKGSDSVDGFATRGLYYNILERSFFPQKYAFELSYGMRLNDPGVATTWDTSVGAWDDDAGAWDDSVVAGTGDYVNTFTSNGTALRFYSGQTSDDGSAITAYWTSHALNRAEQMRFERLTDLWMEYSSVATSNVSVFFGNDATFASSDSRTAVLPPGSARAYVPGHAFGVSPFFRIQATDGSLPKIARMQVKLIDGGLHGGS